MKLTNPTCSEDRLPQQRKARALLLGSTLLLAPFIFAGVASAQTSTTAVGATTTSASSASTTTASLGSTTSASSATTTGAQLVSTTLMLVTTSPASTTATTLPSTNVSEESHVTEEAVDDSAVPEGGIDTGFGGTATGTSNSTGMLASAALFAIAGTAVTTVTVRRRNRR
jgi:hypothetical protein